MTNAKRANGKMIRKIVKLDRAWKGNGRQQGRIENDLAMFLGRAWRGQSAHRHLARRLRQQQCRYLRPCLPLAHGLRS